MIVTATELVRNSKVILDKVVQGEEVQIQRHGKPVAVIRPPVGWQSVEDMARDLSTFHWTEAERAEMRKAIADASKVIASRSGDSLSPR